MNPERYEALRKLAPLDAARAFLEGAFGLGEEWAIVDAIRRDPRVTLDDEEILDVLEGAMEDEVDAETCMARLMAFS